MWAKESKLKARAIYTYDIAKECDSVPIFELQNGKFVCISDQEIQYDIESVLADDDWIIVVIDEDCVVYHR